jgi:hypothetical protein
LVIYCPEPKSFSDQNFVEPQIQNGLNPNSDKIFKEEIPQIIGLKNQNNNWVTIMGVAEKVKRIWKNHFGYIVILAVGLLTIVWLRGEILVWKDWGFPLSSLAADRGFERSLFLWDSSMAGLGWQAARFVQFITLQGFYWVSVHLGIPLAAINEILFYSLFTLSGLSTYFLLATVVSDRKWEIALVAGSLFYMMNFYSLVFIWGGFMTGVIFAYSILPLMIGLTIRALRNSSHLKYAFLISAAWALIGTNTGNPEFALLSLGLVAACCFFAALYDKSKVSAKKSLRFLSIFLVIFAVVNAYWLIPVGNFSGAVFSSISRQSIGETDLQVFRLSSVPFIDGLRLTGFWDVASNYRGDPYYSWAPTALALPFQLALCLVPILSFIPIFFVRKYDHDLAKYVVFFSAVSIFGVILIAGSYPPFGAFFESIAAKLPSLLRLYRFPYQRFGVLVAIGYSFLLALGFGELTKLSERAFEKMTLKHRKFHSTAIPKAIVPVLLFAVLFGFLSFPFWTGDVLYNGAKITPSARVQVPSYYSDVLSFLQKDNSDYNIMSLPMGVLRYSVLDWANGSEGYFAENPDMWLFNKPAIIYADQGNGLSGVFARQLLSNNDFELGTLDGWTTTVFSGNPNCSIEKAGDQFSAEINLPKNSSVGIDRNALYDLNGKPLDYTVNLKEVNGRVGANLAFMFYNQSTYQKSIVSDFVSLDRSRPAVSDLSKVSKVQINKWWFAAVEGFLFDFDSWYFHTLSFNESVSVEVTVHGGGFLDIVSDRGTEFSKKFMEDESTLLTFNPHDVEWIQPRVYSENDSVSQIEIRLVQSIAQENDLVIQFMDQGDVSLHFLANPIEESLSFSPRIVLYATDNQTGSARVQSTFLNDYDYNSNELANLLSLMNVKYIILHDDTNWRYIENNPWWITSSSLVAIQNALSGQKGIDFVGQFGALFIYSNANWTSSHFYSTVSYQFIMDGTHILDNVTELSTNFVSFSESQLNANQLDFVKNLQLNSINSTEIKVEWISPTRYEITGNSSGPFFLTFSETFDKNWVALVNGQKVSDNRHFETNGYANSWYIDNSGSFVVVLEFLPQTLFFYGVLISLVGGIFFALLLVRKRILHMRKTVFATLHRYLTLRR